MHDAHARSTCHRRADTRAARHGGAVLRGVLLLATLLTGALAACSGQSVKDPDGDETRLKARPFSRLGPTEDRLDFAVGDQEDWRFFLPEKAGKLELRISVGKWKESSIEGFVTIFTEVGDRVLERPIPPGSSVTIKAQFDVEPDMRYLVRFKANRGKGEYAVEVGEPENPCDACTDKQECVDNKCVDKPCGGDCPEGQTCDRNANKCVAARERPVNKCEGVSCPKGEVCARSTGRCVAVRSEPAEPQPAAEPDIDATVIDAREAGAGSVLTLSAGDNKGVKKGQTGSIVGLKGSGFTITDVYPSRSKAACKLPPAKIIGHTKAKINR